MARGGERSAGRGRDARRGSAGLCAASARGSGRGAGRVGLGAARAREEGRGRGTRDSARRGRAGEGMRRAGRHGRARVRPRARWGTRRSRRARGARTQPTRLLACRWFQRVAVLCAGGASGPGAWRTNGTIGHVERSAKATGREAGRGTGARGRDVARGQAWTCVCAACEGGTRRGRRARGGAYGRAVRTQPTRHLACRWNQRVAVSRADGASGQGSWRAGGTIGTLSGARRRRTRDGTWRCGRSGWV